MKKTKLLLTLVLLTSLTPRPSFAHGGAHPEAQAETQSEQSSAQRDTRTAERESPDGRKVSQEESGKGKKNQNTIPSFGDSLSPRQRTSE